MSSAILYVAIVVIWACVLIPRWLRRDSPAPVAEDVVEPAPSSVPAVPRRRAVAPVGPDQERAVPARRGASADPVRRRVQSARRRLLLMLVGLSVASAVLAETKMAAWWVIVPPLVMLFGYLLLLREAAKADTERRAMAERGAMRASAGRAPVGRSAPLVARAGVAEVAEARVITIQTAPEPAEEEIYDQYADAKLRAVGD